MDFIQAIADEHVYLFDGAWEMLLPRAGHQQVSDELNSAVRRSSGGAPQYVRRSGIIETNTYGANR